MKKQTPMGMMLLVGMLLLSCCACVQKKGEQIPPVSNSKDVKLEPSIAELRRLYEAAQSPNERRAVCLRAIDEGVIQQDRPVSTIDAIFGSHFAADLPTGKERIRREWILFAPQYSPPPGESEVTEAHAYVGWHMDFDYDSDGTIQNYYLSNLHKGNSSGVDVKKTVSADELRRLYEAAQSEQERRAICLRAIDEGVMQTYHPISPIDEIFGTHFASNLPGRKESIRKASIDLVAVMPSPNDSKSPGHSGWFVAIEYDNYGTLLNYYLTNVHK